jgi:hypothetical protein
MIFYTYVGIDASFPLGLTTFISSRFYDSAGKYKSRLSEEENDVYKEILKNDYLSGGVQISFGVESTRSEPMGAGFSIFTRFADTFSTGGQSTSNLFLELYHPESFWHRTDIFSSFFS